MDGYVKLGVLFIDNVSYKLKMCNWIILDWHAGNCNGRNANVQHFILDEHDQKFAMCLQCSVRMLHQNSLKQMIGKGSMLIEKR